MSVKFGKIRVIGLILLTGLASTPSLATSENAVRVIGQAYDLENDEFLYREVYCANGDPDEMEVIYRDDADAMIAHKLLDYRSGSTTPSFVQQNFYSSEVIEVALRDDEVRMAVIDAASSEPKKIVTEKADSKLPVVIDAGFDEFVRANWDSLLEGEKKYFMFPFAERSSLLELRIKRSGCSYETTSDQCFKLELSNWLVRMLVAPIELGYDPEKKRLLRYRGLSNIGDGKGNGSIVDIRYLYQDLPALACRTDLNGES